jgi:hypothetical protein
MNELEKIIEEGKKSKDNYSLLKDLEVYNAKCTSILFYEENNDYVRIFPKNETHFIDFFYDYCDERVYIVFKKLYDKGLINYIEKLYAHEGTLKVNIKRIYKIKEVENEFYKHFENMIKDIDGDEWNYEIFYEENS